VRRGKVDIKVLSDLELRSLHHDLVVEIAVARSQIEPKSQRRKRTIRVVRGAVVNFAGLLFAVPTNGVSLLVCIVGFTDWAEAIAEDAEAMNRQIELERLRREQETLLAEILAELERRKKLK
jgi:hypothetical protein